MDAMCQTKGGAPLCSTGRALSHARRQLFDMKLTFMGLSHTVRYITQTEWQTIGSAMRLRTVWVSVRTHECHRVSQLLCSVCSGTRSWKL